jgi:UDP-N-acetylglucosamine/UDP-N-acetylgalactosamine diphosphorylase
VGLKQTILFPYVTLGSLINFCDCLMAGGTSRKDHSEVGSSFIHFNYTPNQDKATASIMGDVPSGVMLNQRPIFLGGQGGMVGPCRIAYGTVSAAGTIVRKDQVQPDHLVFGGMGKEGRVPWKPGKLGGSVRIIRNNIYYIGNLFALRHWYDQVRRPFISPRFPEELHAGLLQTLDQGLNERVHRLRLFIEGLNMVKLARAWEAVEVAWSDRAKERGHGVLRDTFLDQLASLRRTGHGAYLKTI